MNMKKTTLALFIIAILATLVMPLAAASVDIEYVEVNGDELSQNTNERLELTEELDIKVRLTATDDVEDIKISAELTGYEYADRNRYDIYDVIVIDDMDANDSTSERLSIEVPKDIDQDSNTLLVRISDNDGTIAEYTAKLNIQGKDNYIDIVRVSFDPAEVEAGRALRTRVRLENLGEEDEEDIFVQVAIPSLGPSMVVSADVDELDEEELTTTEDLLLRIPSCVEPGVYDVEVTAFYDDGYESTTVTESIRVSEGACAAAQDSETTDRTVITPPTSQEIVAGAAGTSFPVIIENDGTEDKTYLVSVSGVNGWGSAEVSSAATFVRSGNTEVVYVYVSANPDAVGQKTFVVTVSDGTNSKDIAVQSRILPGEEQAESMDWKQWVYTGIIVLLVIIVILGLAIGFRKASKDEEEEYY